MEQRNSYADFHQAVKQARRGDFSGTDAFLTGVQEASIPSIVGIISPESASIMPEEWREALLERLLFDGQRSPNPAMTTKLVTTLLNLILDDPVEED